MHQIIVDLRSSFRVVKRREGKMVVIQRTSRRRGRRKKSTTTTTFVNKKCLIASFLLLSLALFLPLMSFLVDLVNKDNPRRTSLHESNAISPEKELKSKRNPLGGAIATHHDEIFDVIIVGGGWSGVSALQSLLHLDKFENTTTKVTLLEARDRLGGRSNSIHNAFDNNGLTTELGSSWVFQDTELGQFLDRFNVSYGTIDYFNTTEDGKTSWDYLGVYAEPGKFASDDDVFVAWDDHMDTRELNDTAKRNLLNTEWMENFQLFSERESYRLEAKNEDASIADTLNKLWNITKLKSGNRFHQLINSLTHFRFEIEYASSIEDLSAVNVGSSINECLFCGCYKYMGVPGGGFDKMIAGLLNDVDIDRYVKFEKLVTKIDYSDELVRVSYRTKQGEIRNLRSRFVIITVPLGVLKAKTIEFVPTLPRWKQSAIDYIGYGTLNKCIMYWERPQTSWWPEGRQILTLISDNDEDSGLWTSFFNDRALGNGGHYILTGFIGGRKAKAEEDRSDQEIMGTALQNLRRMFGDNVPAPTKYIITRWGQDPYARGSYSFIPVGTRNITQMRSDLSKPLGVRRPQVYFAGEATTDFLYATTTGAHRSGIESAKLVRARLLKYKRQGV